MRLTKVAVARLKLPPGKADEIHFDSELAGFGVRLRAGGKKTWIVQYRIGAKQRRVTLADERKLDADAAREEAKRRLAMVTLGGDPQRDKVEARAKAAQTLDAAIDAYLTYKQPILRPASYQETERYLKRHWKTLHGLPVHDIKRADVAADLTKITKEHGTTVAARARAALSGFFTWAMREGYDIEQNPVIGTNRPPEPQSRKRVLSDDELAEVWAACGDDDYGRMIKLVLLTGARREEIGGLTWPEVDIEHAVVSLSAGRTKNNRPHKIPLSPLALSIVKAVERRDGRDHLFGDGPRREGEEPRGFSGWSKAKSALDTRILAARRKAAEKARKPLAEVKPMAPWRLHDLRRTCATAMADRLGVQPHILEAVLNHITAIEGVKGSIGHKAGVAGVYNHARYERETRAALILWADHVRAVVGGGTRKVVPLRGRA